MEIHQLFRDSNPIYRKSKINKYFKFKKNPFLPNKMLEKSIIFISEPYFDKEMTDLSDENKIVIYDRTDNWSASIISSVGEIYGNNEKYILDNSDIVICSSKWLYNLTLNDYPNKKVIYIPNGNDEFNYKEYERENIAIYGGYKLNKVDLNKIFKLAYNNKDWKFEIYTNDFKNFPINNENFSELKLYDNITLHTFLNNNDFFDKCCKAKVGLTLLNDDNWSIGMLPNKIFLYSAAKIPCVFSGSADENFEDYDFCIKYDDTLNLNEICNKKYNFVTRSWNDVCKEIEGVFNEIQ